MYGRFNRTSGKVSLDRTAKSGALDLSVETASIDTGDNDRGAGRVRATSTCARPISSTSPKFPRIAYKSTKVIFNGDNPSQVEGSLTLLGVTKPLQLTVERFKCNPAQGAGKERCGGNATGRIKRSDFGMKAGIPSVGDDIALMISFEGLKD